MQNGDAVFDQPQQQNHQASQRIPESQSNGNSNKSNNNITGNQSAASSVQPARPTRVFKQSNNRTQPFSGSKPNPTNANTNKSSSSNNNNNHTKTNLSTNSSSTNDTKLTSNKLNYQPNNVEEVGNIAPNNGNRISGGSNSSSVSIDSVNSIKSSNSCGSSSSSSGGRSSSIGDSIDGSKKQEEKPINVVTFADHIRLLSDDDETAPYTFGFFDEQKPRLMKASPKSDERRYVVKDKIDANSFNYKQILEFISSAWQQSVSETKTKTTTTNSSSSSSSGGASRYNNNVSKNNNMGNVVSSKNNVSTRRPNKTRLVHHHHHHHHNQQQQQQ